MTLARIYRGIQNYDLNFAHFCFGAVQRLGKREAFVSRVIQIKSIPWVFGSQSFFGEIQKTYLEPEMINPISSLPERKTNKFGKIW